MKLQTTLTAFVLALGITAAAHAQEIKLNLPGKTDAAAPAPAPAAPAAAPAAPAAPTFSEAQLVEEWGWFVGRRIGITELELNAEQIAALAKGIASAAAGKDAPYDLSKAGPLMDGFMKKKQELYLGKLKQQSLAEAATFFTALKKKPGVIVQPDGLCYEIIKPGEGAAPKPTDIVSVNYTGTLISGETFDASHDKPIEIGLDQVIPGWTEGLQKIAKGGKIKLYIPPQLAYGDDGKGAIPPGASLIFEIELVGFRTPTEADRPAPAPAEPAGK